MNEQSKNETANAQNCEEKKVESVDYRSSAGQGQEMRKVDVIHQVHTTKNTSGGILAGAAAAVTSTLQSAKDAVAKK
ncbi:uncharacterized protein LOC124841450 [Vigna umbellata]|uniref:uncharacterized protein LOC108335243 n=1 Tax=Phaseolus angularis TaxID=3914 RepID=UPI000809E6C5|nr:uncharacterized protein LOC108335243 [Vigna angularis]XP_047173685.1 uncharacterized protein LOC124841450 [Vigna umbellata]